MSAAQDRSQMRSMVISKNGIVAAESPLAAQAGVRILESGGNAVDAAIATNAMMGVVAPMMNGIGGDLFAIVYDAKADKLYGLNASGWAPAELTIEMLHKQGLREMPQAGVNTITVPGTVEGWQKLADKFGRKKLSEDLTPAIQTAKRRIPGNGMGSDVLGHTNGLPARGRRSRESVSTERPSTQSRRGVPQRRSGMVAAADRGTWPRCVLQRRSRKAGTGNDQAPRRSDDRAGHGGIFGGMGGTDLDHLPGLDGV